MKPLLCLILATSLQAFGQTDPLAARDSPADPFAAGPGMQGYPQRGDPFGPVKLFFEYFQSEPLNSSVAEMTRDEFKAWMRFHFQQKTTVGFLSLEKVLLVSPLGIKTMTDNGIEVLDWSKFPPEISAKLGLTERVAALYQQAKKSKMHEDARAVNAAREKAARDSIIASRDASTQRVMEPMPADPFGKPARPFPADVNAEIRSAAESKWRGEYDMQVYEIKKQTEALATFNDWRQNGIPGLPKAVSAQILRDSWQKWGCEFDMVIYNAKNQTTAWFRLNGR